MHFALIDKRRYAPNKAEVMHLIGDLNKKDVLIIDDMMNSWNNCKCSSAAIKSANSVTAIATQILSGPAIDRIKESKISKLIVTDTISIPDNKKLDHMQIVTVAEVFAEAIKRVYEGKSVSALFEF